MNCLKRINLKRSSSLANSDRSSSSSTQPALPKAKQGQETTELRPKSILGCPPKRRAVSLNRGTSYSKDSRRRREFDSNDQDFTCPICLDLLYRPRLLSCGHIFCLVCLQRYLNSCLKNFTCPSCRTVVELPENGVNGLPRNTVLERLASVHYNKRKVLIANAQLCYKCYSHLDITECMHCDKGFCSVCQKQHFGDIKNDLLLLRNHLEGSKDKLVSRSITDEKTFKELEEKIKYELEARKDGLLQQVEEIRNTNYKKSQKLSNDLSNTLQSISVDNQMSIEDAWRQYNKLNQMIKSISQSICQNVFLDVQSLTLQTENENCLTVKPNFDRSKLRDSQIPVSGGLNDHAALYKTKMTMCKNKWTHGACKRPAGIAISPWTGHFYVTASDSCKVYIFEPNGRPVSSFGKRGNNDDCFLCPTGITFCLLSKELFITDKWRHCILVFDCAGNFSRQIGKKGKGFGEFSSPEGISTDVRGNLYIADTCNDRVQILDKDGVYLKEVGLLSSEFVGHVRLYSRREFKEPVGVTVTPDGGKIYVADSGNHRIRVYDGQTGEQLLTFGSRGRNKGQFESPENVVVDSEGFIIVGDSGNGRIQIFRPNGRFVRSLGSRGNKRGEFGWVSGLAITKEGEIIVTDFKNNIVAIF